MKTIRNIVIAATALFFLQHCLTPPLRAQNEKPNESPSAVIEDNSFLIEEAFNQEDRIVQHISNAVYFKSPDEFVNYSFTQEWPIGGQTHQFSYTVPYMFLISSSLNGLGDVMVNYRYQATTRERWASIAPRLSIIIPTGSRGRGTGLGTTGGQINIATSKYLSEKFIAHFNAGSTLFPIVKGEKNDGSEIHRTLLWFNTGGSIIWLADPQFHVMLECGVNFNSEIDPNGGVSHTDQLFLNPGVRYALNIDRLQIVPGLGFPIIRSEGATHLGAFFYLSFEHPF